jgi:hypothetical protein
MPNPIVNRRVSGAKGFKVPNPVTGLTWDNFEYYADGMPLNGLKYGWLWAGPFVDAGTTSADRRDSMESYSDTAALNGLNGGTGWSAAYTDRTAYPNADIRDTMESYSDTAALNGLNGGTNWNGAYTDH